MDLLPSPLKRYYCFFFIFFLSWANQSVAQGALDLIPAYSLKHYTDENGLPQNSIKDIIQDSEGFIWLTTENGLVRFDGLQFKVFNRSNLDISSNRFLWFQPSMNKSSGPLFTEVAKNEFVSIEGRRAKVDKKYYKNWMSRIPNIQKGYLQITTPMSSPDAQRHMLTQEEYIVPLSQGNGEFYLCTPHKLTFNKNWEKQREIEFQFSNYWHIFRLGEHLAYLNKNYTITLFNGNSGLKTDLPILGDISKDPLFLSSVDSLKIYWNNTSDQVFLYLNRRLYTLDLTRSETLHTTLLLANFDPDVLGIRTIFHDPKSGRLFLGSWSKGLYLFTPKNFHTVHFPLKENHQIFYGQTAITDSSILVPHGYSVSLDLPGQKTTLQAFPEILKQSLYNFPMLIDKQGDIWGVTASNSLIKFSSTGKKLLKKWKKIDETISILYQKNDEEIVIVTQTGQIYRINPLESGAPRLVFQKKMLNQCIGQKQDTLFLGTDKGLYKISPSFDKVTLVPGTQHLNVRSLFIPETGEIWLTTYGNGIFLYQNNKLIKLPSDKKHFLDTSHCIIEDKNGYFWITTNKGLFQVLKSDLLHYDTKSYLPYYHYYARESGFNTNEFNGGCQPCALRLKNGYVSLPSLSGLVLFSPENTKAEEPVANLFIDDVTVGNKPYTHTQASLNLPFNPANVRIQITTPYFGQPNNLHLYYTVTKKGAIPDTWIPLSEDGVIPLSNLPSGSHTLYVKKQNGFGVNNHSTISFSINVKKAWYETWWFMGGVTICLVAAIFILIKLQTRNLMQKNRLLERAVDKRTESLKDIVRALKESENELSRQLHMQTRIIASLTHDVRSPLRAVTSISLAIGPMIQEEKYEFIAEIGQSISESTQRISTMLDNTLDYVKVQLSQKRIQFESVNLFDLMASKIQLFSLSSENQNNKFRNDIPVNISVISNTYLLSIIINNLLDNANKNTVNGLIRIHTESTSDNLTLKISDTGYGIPDHFIQWLNIPDRESIEQENMHLNKVSGIGLIIVKEIARMLGLTLHAERNPKGSSVSIYFDTSSQAIEIH